MWYRLIIDGNSVYEIDEECSAADPKDRGQEVFKKGSSSENLGLRGTENRSKGSRA